MTTSKRLFYLLGSIAIVYAFVAGFKTINEFDLGWQMATGRWIVQHHQIPSTEVFSYTAAGQPWIYPVGAGLIFYWLYLAGGYWLITWFVAIAGACTIALLLRRGSAITAALAILAVPLIASRATARAEIFTVILFTATLSLLWEQRETGKARLWLLPLMMIAWVNLHPGFIAGLGLLAAYAGFEIFDFFNSARRDAAKARLRGALPWMGATCAATLINPWGWDVYQVLLRQEAAMGVHSELILEWAPIPMNWTHIVRGLSPLSPDDFYVLLLIVAIAAIVAVVNRRIGEAILIAAAAYFPIRHTRFVALFSIIVVIGAGAILTSIVPAVRKRLRYPQVLAGFGVVASVLFVALASTRVWGMVTDREYRSGAEIVSFGTGLSWFFPQKAADFVERENLPGEIFSTGSEGAFMAFRLGPKYRDYIDGRAIPFGEELMLRSGSLKMTPPDAPQWDQEIARYGINTIVLPIGRYGALQFFPAFRSFCESDRWSPVYLDETSVVFLRRTEQNESWIKRLAVDCFKTPLPVAIPTGNGTAAFNTWANAAAVLGALGRKEESLAAIEKALAIVPESGYLHFTRGHMREESGDLRGAEQDYLKATRVEPKLVAPWSALGAYYQRHGRLDDAIRCWEMAASVSRWPWEPLENLGYAQLMAHRPQQALESFDAAQKGLPARPELVVDNNFLANIEHGRARCWFYLGDLHRAIFHEESAARLLPANTDLWQQLGDLYAAAGRPEDASRARAHLVNPHMNFR
jgi:tetratricopeptide (TPR) repeat protein